jgi:hypothetical protein
MGIYIRKDQPRYWLVESHREGSKVIQTRLKYLGRIEPTAAELAVLKEQYKDKVPSLKHKLPREKKK